MTAEDEEFAFCSVIHLSVSQVVLQITRTGATQMHFAVVETMRQLHHNERMPITPVMISDE